MKYIKSLYLLVLCATASLQSITFNVSLNNLACVDLFITKEVFLNSNQFDTSSNNVIANYSFCLNNEGNALVWSKTMLFPNPFFLTPQQHYWIPTQQQKQFTITLSAEEIEAITGLDLNQVYVRAQQRTYTYTPENGLTLSSYNLIANNFYATNAVLTLQASGTIALANFLLLPNDVKNTYTLASGYVS